MHYSEHARVPMVVQRFSLNSFETHSLLIYEPHQAFDLSTLEHTEGTI